MKQNQKTEARTGQVPHVCPLQRIQLQLENVAEKGTTYQIPIQENTITFNYSYTMRGISMVSCMVRKNNSPKPEQIKHIEHNGKLILRINIRIVSKWEG